MSPALCHLPTIYEESDAASRSLLPAQAAPTIDPTADQLQWLVSSIHDSILPCRLSSPYLAPTPTASTPGYCYLSFFNKNLGPNPTISLLHALSRHPKYIRYFSPSKVHLTITGPNLFHASQSRSHSNPSSIAYLNTIAPTWTVGAQNADPADALRNLTSPDHNTTYQQRLLADLLQNEASVSEINPYHLKPEYRSLCQELGLPLMATPVQTHDHPMPKILENYNLRKAAYQTYRPCTVVNAKEQKFSRLQRWNSMFTHLWNIALTAEDYTRYQQVVLDRFPPSLPTPSLFIHDTLHHLSPSDVLALFDKYTNLEELQATMMLPPEMINRTASIYPELYDVSYRDNGQYCVIFQPTGKHYFGALQRLEWLSVRHVYSKTTVLTVEILESLAGWHRVYIRRGKYLAGDENYFHNPGLVKLPEIFTLMPRNTTPYLPRRLYVNVLTYLKRASAENKRVTRRDLEAKIAQYARILEANQVKSSTLRLLVEVFMVYQELDTAHLLHSRVHTTVLGHVKHMLLDQWWHKSFGRIHRRLYERLSELIDNNELYLFVPRVDYAARAGELTYILKDRQAGFVNSSQADPRNPKVPVGELPPLIRLKLALTSDPRCAAKFMDEEVECPNEKAVWQSAKSEKKPVDVTAHISPGLLSTCRPYSDLPTASFQYTPSPHDLIRQGHRSPLRRVMRKSVPWFKQHPVYTANPPRFRLLGAAAGISTPEPPLPAVRIYRPVIEPSSLPVRTRWLKARRTNPFHPKHLHSHMHRQASAGQPAIRLRLQPDCTFMAVPYSQVKPLPMRKVVQRDYSTAPVAPPKAVPPPPAKQVEANLALLEPDYPVGMNTFVDGKAEPKPESTASGSSRSSISGWTFGYGSTPTLQTTATEPAPEFKPNNPFAPPTTWTPEEDPELADWLAEQAQPEAQPAGLQPQPSTPAEKPETPTDPLPGQMFAAADLKMLLPPRFAHLLPALERTVNPWDLPDLNANFQPAQMFLPSTQCRKLFHMPTANTCGLEAAARALRVEPHDIWRLYCLFSPSAYMQHVSETSPELDEGLFEFLAAALNVQFTIVSEHHPVTYGPAVECPVHVIRHTTMVDGPGHFSYVRTGGARQCKYCRRRAMPSGTCNLCATCHRCGVISADVERRFCCLACFPRKFARSDPDSIEHVLRDLNLNFKQHKVTPTFKQYVRELKFKMVGKLPYLPGSDARIKGYDSLCDNFRAVYPRGRHVQVSCIFGAAGCGKSRHVRDTLLKHKSNNAWKVVFPTLTLRYDWARKMDLGAFAYKLRTYELGLLSHGYKLLVVEECKMPPGYVDFLCALDPKITHVVLLGDPCQGDYHNDHPESELNGLPSNLQQFLPYADEYIYYTYRVARHLARRIGLPSQSRTLGGVSFSLRARKGLPVLVASHQEKFLYTSAGYECYTYSESQGKDFDGDWQMVISDATLNTVDQKTLYVAVTRGKGRLRLIRSFRSPHARQLIARNPILAGVILDHAIPFFQIFRPILKGLHLRLADNGAGPRFFKVGGRSLTKTQKAQRAAPGWSKFAELDPSQRALYDAVPWFSLHEPNAAEPPAPEEPARTHLPVDNPEVLIEKYSSLLGPTEERELSLNAKLTGMFQEITDYEDNRYDLLFMHHKADDDVLFSLAVQKRLTKSTRAANAASLRDKSHLGPILFESLCTALKLPNESVPFSHEDYSRCIYENELNKLSSPIARLLANVDRSDHGWPINFLQIFQKAQRKEKTEVLVQNSDGIVPGKTSQTLACASDLYVLLFGPLGRYLTEKLFAYKSDALYIHTRTGPVDLDRWTKRYLEDSRICTTNDFTAYDQSQSADALALELIILQYFNIPASLIDLYREIKLNTQTFLGVLSIMRFTGEWCTFLFNTVFNIAYTYTMYNLTPEDACAFAGDDSVILSDAKVNPTWVEVERHFDLQSKVQRTRRPEFVGWYLTPNGIYRNPLLLHFKLERARLRKELPKVLQSYFLESLFAYRMGDDFSDYATEEDLIAHQSNTRFFAKHQNLIPSYHLISNSRLARVLHLFHKVVGYRGARRLYHHSSLDNKAELLEILTMARSVALARSDGSTLASADAALDVARNSPSTDAFDNNYDLTDQLLDAAESA